jgi:hypothetical protein
MDIVKKIEQLKKGKNWFIRGDGQPAAESISYKKMIEYCEVIYLMGVKEIVVEYLDEDKIYIFEYSDDFDDVIFIDEEDY